MPTTPASYDAENTITLPDGEVIVLARAKPRSLESYYGLLVQALLDYYDSYSQMVDETCAARDEEEDESRDDRRYIDLSWLDFNIKHRSPPFGVRPTGDRGYSTGSSNPDDPALDQDPGYYDPSVFD